MIILSRPKTKGKRSRVVPMSHVLSDMLGDMKSSADNVINGYSVDMMKKHWLKLLKVLPFTWNNDNSNMRFHDLRHICPTESDLLCGNKKS